MGLYNYVEKNIFLRFVDETNPSLEYKLNELDLCSIDESSKKIVFLYLDNSLRSVSDFFSVLRSSHVLVLLSLDLAPNFKTELEQLYKPSIIFDSKRTTIDGYRPGKHFFENKNETSFDIHPEIKLLLSTSGTTGSPKFVKLSDSNLLNNAQSIASYLPITSTDVTPLNLPLFYSYGLSVLTSNALKGGKIVCGNSDVLSRSFWNNMAMHGYTSIAGVPFVYEMLDRIGFTKKKYPSLRYLTQAGGKLQNNLVQKYADFAEKEKLLFYLMYGQTEATARISYLPPEKLRKKIGCIGIPIPNGRMFINKENSELCYEGPNVFGGYVSSPGDLKTFSPPKHLNTGDLAKQDEDGFFYITGRLKRFVKLFGNRVNLDEVESIVAKNFDIHVKTIGIEDKQLLVVSDKFIGKENEIKDFLVKELKFHPSIVRLREINEIPLTSNGKVDYKAINEVYGG